MSSERWGRQLWLFPNNCRKNNDNLLRLPRNISDERWMKSDQITWPWAVHAVRFWWEDRWFVTLLESLPWGWKLMSNIQNPEPNMTPKQIPAPQTLIKQPQVTHSKLHTPCPNQCTKLLWKCYYENWKPVAHCESLLEELDIHYIGTRLNAF